MLPIVIRIDRGDAASSCPTTCARPASASAPASARTILTVVLPAALPGIVSRRAARRRPRRRRDGAAAVHHRRRHARSTGTCSTGANTALSVADLRQRHTAVRRRPGPGLGRRAHAHRHRLRVHRHRPCRLGPVRPEEVDDAVDRHWSPRSPPMTRRRRHRPSTCRRRRSRRRDGRRQPRGRARSPRSVGVRHPATSPSTTARSGPCAT